jgi:hypothetical protein
MPTLKTTTIKQFQDKLTLDKYLREHEKLETPVRIQLFKKKTLNAYTRWTTTVYEIHED